MILAHQKKVKDLENMIASEYRDEIRCECCYYHSNGVLYIFAMHVLVCTSSVAYIRILPDRITPIVCGRIRSIIVTHIKMFPNGLIFPSGTPFIFLGFLLSSLLEFPLISADHPPPPTSPHRHFPITKTDHIATHFIHL